MIGVGELLWDMLPTGQQLGGAPANFAYHAHALGAKAMVVSCVGKDALGKELLERLCRIGLNTDSITINLSAPTGTVSVTIDVQGKPTFTIHENVAWDFIEASADVLRDASRADAICFGSLAQRSAVSRKAIQALVAATPTSCLRVFDINIRQHFFSQEVIEHSLKLANVLKLNDSELPVLATLYGLYGPPRQQLETLAQRFGLRVVALTCGAEGSLLLHDGRWSELPSVKVDVKDTVGAGDSFTAALCLGLLCGMDLGEIHNVANQIAAHVCSCVGATPILPKQLCQKFKNL